MKESLNISKKHRDRDNDDPDYKRLRSIENLFNKIDEDYYKPKKLKVLLTIITQNMNAEGTKTKIYHLKNILI